MILRHAVSLADWNWPVEVSAIRRGWVHDTAEAAVEATGRLLRAARCAHHREGDSRALVSRLLTTNRPFRHIAEVPWRRAVCRLDDGSLLEAASWRLASELVRRHPSTTRLIRAHPGGGQYDLLWVKPGSSGSSGSISLNRNGTIQVPDRFDGRRSDWQPTQWDEYFRADPREFLVRLEAAAGLPAPGQLPAATPMTLTLRVLAAIAATGVKSVHPIEIVPGYIDTSGYGGGPNEEAFESFSAIPRELRAPRGTYLDGDYRILVRVPRRRAGARLRAEQRLGVDPAP